MRFRFVLLLPVAAALLANVVAYVWEIQVGTEDIEYYLLRIGAGAAVLTGATIAVRARARADEAISAAVFSAMLTFMLTWVPVVILAYLDPPS